MMQLFRDKRVLFQENTAMLPDTSVPDELPPEVPRPAKFTASTQVSRLFLLALLLFAVGILWWLADRDLGNMAALKARGQTAMAHVVGKHITQGKSTSYYLDYTFDGDGIWVDGKESVGRDEYEDNRPGEAIQVTFLPSRPDTYLLGAVTQARIEARQGRWLWGEFGAFVFFSLLLIGAEATFRQHLSLLRDGSVAVGTITDRSISPSQNGFFVTYQFTVDGRFAVESRSHSKKVVCTQPFYEQTELGQVLTILYNPASPSQNIPYQMLTDVALSNRGKTA